MTDFVLIIAAFMMLPFLYAILKQLERVRYLLERIVVALKVEEHAAKQEMGQFSKALTSAMKDSAKAEGREQSPPVTGSASN